MSDLASGDRDLIELGGQTLSTHGPDKCAGDSCCIHAPSEHPLNTAQQVWSQQMRLIFRVCSCGVIHPDPDALRHHILHARGLIYDGNHPCCDRRCCVNREEPTTVE